MRNKLPLIISLSGLLIIIIVVSRNIELFSTSEFPSPTPTPYDGVSSSAYYGNTLDIKFKDQNLKVSYFKISEVNKISLHPNFEEKLTSTEVLQKEGCKFLANGGFYDKDNRPIGLFVTKGEKLSDEINSSLFNGFVDISDGVFRITQEPQSASFVLQTGPILVKDSYLWNLKLRNDEFARRIVVATTDEENYFFAIYNKDSQISGPLLTDMPEITNLIAEKLGITVIDAINLDGGSASAFYDGATLLRELSPIGSYFCIN